MTPRDKAKKINRFIRYTDSSGDFFRVACAKNTKQRNELAELLWSIRKVSWVDRWAAFYFMEYYIKHFFISWNHGCSYHDEALELMNELSGSR